MRKDGIGYLPDFKNTVETVKVLLNFFKEEKGTIELKYLLESYFGKKDISNNTVRLLQNTLSNYGLIYETQDYVYTVTDRGREWIKKGGEEELLMIIHEHVTYMGELLLELEGNRMSREEIQERAISFCDVKFSNTDITRRLQIFKSTGMVDMNRQKKYSLTQKGRAFLSRLELDVESQTVSEKQNKADQNAIEKEKPFIIEKQNEYNIIKNLYKTVVYYFANRKSNSSVDFDAEIKSNIPEIQSVKADVLIYTARENKKIPELVIEVVTEETRNKDFLEKLFVYQKMGVKECWMVDYVSENVVIYDWKNGIFDIENINQKIRSKNFPDLNINFTSLQEK